MNLRSEPPFSWWSSLDNLILYLCKLLYKCKQKTIKKQKSAINILKILRGAYTALHPTVSLQQIKKQIQ
jgi:hypothetical protein